MELKQVKIAELKPHPQNPRVHPDSAIDKLTHSIKEFGWTNPVLISSDGFILAGHSRVKAAQKMGLEEVPSIQLDLTGDKATAYLIADNKLQDLTDWDFPKLKDLLEELDTGAFDLDLTGFDTKEIEDLMTQYQAPGEGLTEEDELPEYVPTICQKGDLWQLGEHRLLCGDSTVITDVERLMGGEKADLIWTDPPYGVSYGEKLEKANPQHYKVRTIENDNLTPESLEEFLRTAFSNAALCASSNAAIYVACPPGTLLPYLIAAFSGSGFDYRWQLVWLKDQIVLSRADYHFKHENILYGWKTGGSHYFTKDRKQSSVFEYPRPKSSPEHPTMKPVALIEHMVNNSSKINNLVLDIFGGSGSTLLACEKTQRKCRMMEINEHYCDVIIKRWEDYTGNKAVRL